MIIDVGGTVPSETELRSLMLAFALSIMDVVAGVSSATGVQGITVNPTTGAITINLNGTVSENVVASSGSAVTLPAPSSHIGSDVTLSTNCTFTMPTATRGSYLYVRTRNSGGFTGTFTGVLWPSGTAPTLTSGVDQYEFQADGTSWHGVTAYQNSH